MDNTVLSERNTVMFLGHTRATSLGIQLEIRKTLRTGLAKVVLVLDLRRLRLDVAGTVISFRQPGK